MSLGPDINTIISSLVNVLDMNVLSLNLRVITVLFELILASTMRGLGLQQKSGAVALPPPHVYPFSMLHRLLQPSPLTRLPSSQK